MRAATSYSFNPSVSKSFRIFFGENLEKRISPTRLSIGRVYPNPTSGATVVSFSLPETQSMMNVSLEVFDMMGRKISTLAKGQMAAGFYTTEWDANTSQAIDGLYICKLMVTGNDKQSMVTEKIIVKR
jgi:flagellar hook assembly protein FlgD